MVGTPRPAGATAAARAIDVAHNPFTDSGPIRPSHDFTNEFMTENAKKSHVSLAQLQIGGADTAHPKSNCGLPRAGTKRPV
jgi:hypothetical protein